MSAACIGQKSLPSRETSACLLDLALFKGTVDHRRLDGFFAVKQIGQGDDEIAMRRQDGTRSLHLFAQRGFHTALDIAITQADCLKRLMICLGLTDQRATIAKVYLDHR